MCLNNRNTCFGIDRRKPSRSCHRNSLCKFPCKPSHIHPYMSCRNCLCTPCNMNLCKWCRSCLCILFYRSLSKNDYSLCSFWPHRMSHRKYKCNRRHMPECKENRMIPHKLYHKYTCTKSRKSPNNYFGMSLHMIYSNLRCKFLRNRWQRCSLQIEIAQES